MTEERCLMAAGVPLEDAISICHALRRERYELPEFVRQKEDERRRRREDHHERILTV